MANSAPFTPYPWIEGPFPGSVVSVSERDDDRDTQDWFGGKVICQHVDPQNLPVITAAPQMVESLIELIDHLEQLHCSLQPAEIPQDRIDSISRARAILISIYQPKQEGAAAHG